MISGRRLRRAIGVVLFAALAVRLVRSIGAPPLSRYVVEGSSMEPAFMPGDRVIVSRRAFRARAPRVGEVVVLRDPERDGHVLLKRVAEAPPGRGSANGLYVLGDNSAQSRDSRAFGAVDPAEIVGKAWIKY